MTMLTATVFYAGLLGLLALALAIRVSRTRAATKIPLGDGGNETMQRAIRAHANFIEFVPLCLILIGLLEMAHAPRWLVHGLGIALVIARLLHAWGMSQASGPSLGRNAGAGLQYLVLLVAAAVCTYYGAIWRAL
jgi:uncharacterized membrane protein YecN with MAPEG domain